MTDWPVLAERKLLMEEDGVPGRKDVSAQIGFPYWSDEGEVACCRVTIDGFWTKPGEIYGVDFVQALQLAAEFLDRVLSTQKGAANRFFWPTGEPYTGTTSSGRTPPTPSNG